MSMRWRHSTHDLTNAALERHPYRPEPMLAGSMLKAWQEGRLSFDVERMESVISEPLAFESTPAAARRRVARRLARAVWP